MKNFKRISAIFISVLMVFSCLGFATATTYPAPFVENGAADVAIVYGTNADNLDSVAAGNIKTNLAGKLGGGSGEAIVSDEGKSVLLAKSSDNLNLGDRWTDVFTGTIDDTDMPTLLADGTYIADDGDTFDYEQSITIGNPNFTHFRDSDYEEEVGLNERTPILGFKISSSTFIMNYTLDFISDAETDIDSGDAEDIEGSMLPLFGREYYVSNLDNGSTGQNAFFGKLTLLDAAETATIKEGETITVMGHEISLAFIDADEVAFMIDGERVPSSGKLTTSTSPRDIGNDEYLGVTDISKAYETVTGSATFSIGRGKLEITSSTSATEIELNDVAIDGVRGFVHMGTASSGVEKIDKIVIEWVSDDELFLTPGKELVMPGFEAIKFTMGNFVRPAEEKVTIQPDGDSSMELLVPMEDGTIGFNLVYSNASGDIIGIGKANDERLATSANTSLVFMEKNWTGDDFHEYFVATYNTSTEAESYLLRAKVNYDSNADRNETTIQKYTASGAWVDVCKDKIAGKTCNVGDVSFNIDFINYSTTPNYGMRAVHIDAPEANDVNFKTVFTEGGLKIYLPHFVNGSGSTSFGVINCLDTSGLYANSVLKGCAGGFNETAVGHSMASFKVYMNGEDKQDNLESGLLFDALIDDTSDNNLQLKWINGSGTGGPHGLEKGNTQIYEAYVVDDVAPRMLHYTQPDEDYMEIYYPTGDSESYAQVYLAEASVVVTTEGTGAEIGDIIVTDAEVSSVQTKNLIVVGGSCINSVAANLVGGAYCEAEWTSATGAGAGQFIIQSFGDAYTTGKIALLVAGYEKEDTQNAQKYLINKVVDTTAGKKYLGTSSTEATLQVA